MAQATGQLKPPKQIPKDLREFSRWCQEQSILVNQVADDTVSTDAIVDEAVTLAKMADLAGDRFIGRLSTTGVPQALTGAQVVGVLEGETWAFSGEVNLDGTVGFFSATAVGQQTTPSTLSLSSVSGTGDDATINSNFSAIQSAVNAIKTALDNLGLTA